MQDTKDLNGIDKPARRKRRWWVIIQRISSLPLMHILVRDREARIIGHRNISCVVCQRCAPDLNGPIDGATWRRWSNDCYRVASGFLCRLKWPCVICLIAMPFILYHIWAFIAPALYDRKRRPFSSWLQHHAVYPVLALLLCGDAAGIGFVGFVPEGIAYMPDISNHLDFD